MMIYPKPYSSYLREATNPKTMNPKRLNPKTTKLDKSNVETMAP